MYGRTVVAARTKENPIIVQYNVRKPTVETVIPFVGIGNGKYKEGVFQFMQATPVKNNGHVVGIVKVIM
jgi:hypothetical protein